jgi:hypothetical protein
MSPPARPLGDDYVIGAGSAATFNHFLWLQLVRPATLKRLAGLVGALKTESTRRALVDETT